MSEKDNSYMFVDEDKEDISAAGGGETKGRYFDETITGSIEDKSTINLVADEDISSELSSFQERIEKRAASIQENLADANLKNITDNIRDNIKDNNDEPSSVALSSERITSEGKGLGIASLFFGVVSIALFCSIFNVFTAIISIVLGVIQIRRGTGKGLAITGIVCSILSFVLLIVCMSLISSNEAFVNMITENMFNMNMFIMK